MKQRLLLLSLLTVFCVKGMSQGSENIPVEGSTFYLENGEVSIRKAFTRADNNDMWTFKSVAETCFDQSMVGKDAWLMTADGETKLKVTFEYNTGDERYAIESADVSFYFYDGDDLFHDDKKQLVTDAAVIGTYTKEVKEKSVTLHMTAPKIFPDPKISWYAFYVVLDMKFKKDKGGAAVARQIGVSRNGLLLMHGLNSNRQCFWPFGEYLYNTGSYLKQQYYIQDYSSTNTSSFYDNTHTYRVVENGLKTLSKKLLDIGIASTKYDMIGHSMGGILERLYIQQIDNKHTFKLITLNTPHFGSNIGNVIMALDNIEQMPIVDSNLSTKTARIVYDVAKFCWASTDHSKVAIEDLAVGGAAIQALGWSVDKLAGIRVCAVGTEIDWLASVERAYAASDPYYQAWSTILLNVFGKEVKHERVYVDESADGTDGVVSVNSQKGGCEKTYIYRGILANANHCGATEWDVVHAWLLELLTSPKSGDFCLTGFGTPPNVRTRSAENFEFFTDWVAPKSSSYIRIEGQKVENQPYTHEFKIHHSSDMAKTVAFCVLTKDDVVYDFDKDVMCFDMSGLEGESWVYAIGRTNYNALVIDSVKVKEGGVVDGIKHVEDNAELRYTIAGNNLMIKNVAGPYSVAVYNAAGQMLAEMNSNPSNTYALPRNKGLLIIKVRSNKGKQFFKVLTK